MEPVRIVKVQTRSDLSTFIDYPSKLYKNAEYWVPALRSDEFESLRKDRNAAFEYCDADYFLAYRGSRVVGRVAGIINKKANEIWNEHTVRFGWLDFEDDSEVVSALMDTVAAWGRERGCSTMKGPLGFTDMDKEGLLVEGFDKICPFTCLWNYPYYDPRLQEYGLVTDADWSQRIVSMPEEEPEIFRFCPMVEKRYGLHIYKPKNIKELVDRYGMALFHMYNETFAPLYQFAPLNDGQIKAFLKSYGAILDSRFLAILLDSDDQIAGFAFTVPSLAKAIKKAKGRLFPFGFIYLLRALHKNDLLEALMIGIHPKYQSSGAGILLFKYIYDNAKPFGIKKMTLNPQLIENTKVQSMFRVFPIEPYMIRRSYTKEI